jgi:hypothetical protein
MHLIIINSLDFGFEHKVSQQGILYLQTVTQVWNIDTLENKCKIVCCPYWMEITFWYSNVFWNKII